MSEVELVISVIGLFMVRIGLPLIALVSLGTIVERWQRKFHEKAQKQG